MPDVIRYVRIYIALVDRTSKEYDGRTACRRDFHPRQRHHWHLLIEKEGFPRDWRKWDHCHTLETRAWQRTANDRGNPEDFEDGPFVGSAEALRLVRGSMFHVASIEAQNRHRFIAELQGLSNLVDRQRKHGETCRYFIENILLYLHKYQNDLGIVYPEHFRRRPHDFGIVARWYMDQKLIDHCTPEKVFVPPPLPPPPPMEENHKLRSKRSVRLFSRKSSEKDNADPSTKNRSKQQQKQERPERPRPAISRPEPQEINSISLSNQAPSIQNRRQGSKDSTLRMRPEPEPERMMLRSGMSRYIEKSEKEDPRRYRASDNPQSYRQNMAQRLGMRDRKSSPT